MVVEVGIECGSLLTDGLKDGHHILFKKIYIGLSYIMYQTGGTHGLCVANGVLLFTAVICR